MAFEDIVRLVLGVDSTEVPKGTEALKGLEQQADKTADAVDHLGQTSKTADEKWAAYKAQLDANAAAHEKVTTKTIATGVALGTLVEKGLERAVEYVIEFGKRSIEAFSEAEARSIKLDAQLKVAGETAHVTAANIIALGHEIERTTNFSATAAENAASSLLKYGSLSKESFGQAIKLAADLAAVTGHDLVASTELVGRALENSYGVTALRRQGLLTDAQVEYLKLTKEINGEVAFQSALFDTLGSKVGGLAEEMGGKGLAGATKQLGNEWEHWLEGIGKFLTQSTGLEDKLQKVGAMLKFIREQGTVSSSGATGYGAAGDAASAFARFVRGPDTTDQVSRGIAQTGPLLGGDKPNADAMAKARNDILKEQTDGLKKLGQETEHYLKTQETLADKLAQVDQAFKAGGLARDLAEKQWGTQENAVRQITAAYNELHKGHDTIQKDLNAQLAAYKTLNDALVDTSPAQRKYNELLSALSVYQADANTKLELRNAIEERYEPTAVQARKNQEEEGKALAKAVEDINKENAAIEQQVAIAQKHAASIGKTKEQLDEKAAAEIDAALATAQHTLSEAEATTGAASTAYVEGLKERVRVLTELKAALNDVTSAQASADQAAAAAKGARELQRQYEETARSISNSLTNAIEDWVFNGKSAAQSFGQWLQNMFRNLILRPVLQAGVNGVLGIGGGGGGVGGTAGGIGGIGNIFSGIGNLSSSFGTGAINFGLSDIGQSLGLSAVGSGASGALELTSLGGAFTGIATAIPYIGLAVAAGMLVKSFLDSKRGGPKQGGFSSTIGVPSFFPGEETSAGNTTAAGLTSSVNAAYQQAITLLGGRGGAGFSLGFDTDPQGTAQSRVSSSVFVGGRSVYGTRDVDVGRDDASLQAALQLETKKMLLAALQASDLPKDVADLLNSVSVQTATSDAVDKVLALASALKAVDDALGGGVIADGMKAFADAGAGVLRVLEKQREEIRKQITAYDGSIDATNALSQSTQAYYQNAVAVVAQIQDLRKQIGTNTGDITRGFQLSVLDDKGQYAFLQKEVEKLRSELGSSTDPTRIAALVTQINSDLQQAYGLLSPDQQKAAVDQFIKGAQTVADEADKRLAAIQQTVQNDTKGMMDEIKAAILAAVAPMQTAADKQLDAAEGQLQASKTPQVVVVQVDYATGNVNGG